MGKRINIRSFTITELIVSMIIMGTVIMFALTGYISVNKEILSLKEDSDSVFSILTLESMLLKDFDKCKLIYYSNINKKLLLEINKKDNIEYCFYENGQISRCYSHDSILFNVPLYHTKIHTVNKTPFVVNLQLLFGKKYSQFSIFITKEYQNDAIFEINNSNK